MTHLQSHLLQLCGSDALWTLFIQKGASGREFDRRTRAAGNQTGRNVTESCFEYLKWCGGCLELDFLPKTGVLGGLTGQAKVLGLILPMVHHRITGEMPDFEMQ